MRNFKNNFRRNRYKSHLDRNHHKHENGAKLINDLQNGSGFVRANFGRNNHNASKLIEKYSNLAREALSKGDKILSENYFQHAEHFIRILGEKDALNNKNQISKDLKKNSNQLIEECYIGNKIVKIYGIAKGSGMIFPNMATTLGFVFTDATISSKILKQLLKQNIEKTFNAISCDGDTSTNDMVSIFATGEVSNSNFNSAKDKKLSNFNSSLFNVLLNLAKRVAADGEGASKFISIKVKNCKTEEDAKKISFSIANSPLVKTAIAGEDPNWGRIIMAIGKANVNLNPNKLGIKFGNISIIENGKLSPSYNEDEATIYMKEEKIDLLVNLNMGKKEFTSYTMDLTKKYIEINSDYRS